MADIWPRYPDAEWVPWLYPNAEGKLTYYKNVMSKVNPPMAGVQHIMAGYATTARAWAVQGFWPKSWTYTCAGDHTWSQHVCPYSACPKTEPYVMQHLRLQDGGYHAGIRYAEAVSYPPRWKLYRGPNINVNKYTWGCEVEGFPSKNGRIEWSPKQLELLKNLHEWNADVLDYKLSYDTAPPHADIAIRSRVNDFDVPSERDIFYDHILSKKEPPMSWLPSFTSLRARVRDIETVLAGGKKGVEYQIRDEGNFMLGLGLTQGDVYHLVEDWKERHPDEQWPPTGDTTGEG